MISESPVQASKASTCSRASTYTTNSEVGKIYHFVSDVCAWRRVSGCVREAEDEFYAAAREPSAGGTRR